MAKSTTNEAQNWVVEELTALIRRNESQTERENEEQISHNTNVQLQQESASSDMPIWEFFDQKASQMQSHVTTCIVKQYIQMPLLDRKKDPLVFWREHSATFPNFVDFAM